MNAGTWNASLTWPWLTDYFPPPHFFSESHGDIVRGLAYYVTMTNYSDSDLLNKLTREIEAAGGQAAWAKLHGFSPSFICDVLAGTRPVTDRLAKALGFAAARSWRKT